MTEITEGNTSVDIPALGRQDEMGAMAKSVQVFVDNLIEMEHMQAEQKAEQTEKERLAAERAEADRKAAEEQSHLSVHRTLEQETADELAWVKGHENPRR